MSDFQRYYASMPEGERVFLTFSLSHSALSQTYYYVDDSVNLTVADPEIVGGVFTATLLGYEQSLQNNDLDQNARFTISDLDDSFDDEMERIPAGDIEPVIFTTRLYHNSDLTTPAQKYIFSVESVSQQKGVALVSLAQSLLNISDTGGVYSYSQFPMLRGL